MNALNTRRTLLKTSFPSPSWYQEVTPAGSHVDANSTQKMIRRDYSTRRIEWYSIADGTPTNEHLIDLTNAAALQVGIFSRLLLLDPLNPRLDAALNYLAPIVDREQLTRFTRRLERWQRAPRAQQFIRLNRLLTPIGRLLDAASPHIGWLRLGIKAGDALIRRHVRTIDTDAFLITRAHLHDALLWAYKKYFSRHNREPFEQVLDHSQQPIPRPAGEEDFRESISTWTEETEE